jgi:membrane associated rhomboid family serine protease
VIFIPVSDDNPLRFVPYQYVTVGLIAANVLVYLWQVAGIGPSLGASFTLVPAELFQAGVFGGSALGRYDTLVIPEGYTLFSYMFFHSDLLHLSTNMLFLWVFGDNVEDAMGHLKYLVFYLACGAVGGLMHAWMSPGSWLPLVGASGAVAGVIAAYLMLHPRVRVWVLAFRVIPMRITAAWILGLWIFTQAFMLIFNRADQVAWSAHIGGILAGAALIVFMRRPGLELFDGATILPELAHAAITGPAIPSGPSEVP